jgi:hypothetical protein
MLERGWRMGGNTMKTDTRWAPPRPDESSLSTRTWKPRSGGWKFLSVLCYVIAGALGIFLVVTQAMYGGMPTFHGPMPEGATQVWATGAHPDSFSLDLALDDRFVIAPAPDGTATLNLSLPARDTVQGYGDVTGVRLRSTLKGTVGRPVHGDHSSWGGVITYSGTANESWTPQVKIVAPVDRSLVGESFRIRVLADLTYPEVSSGGFQDATGTETGKIEIYVREQSIEPWTGSRGIRVIGIALGFVALGLFVYWKKARARFV